MEEKSILKTRQAVLEEFNHLSGKEILDRIEEHENAVQLIRKLTSEDLFWLVKKVGGDDSVALLRMANTEQWQYLLDMEIWRKDRLELNQAFLWLDRLRLADPVRLVRWLFSEGQHFAYYYFYNNIQVYEIKEEDDEYDLENGFISFEGVFYIRVLHEDQRETIESILKTMAGKDLERYQALLLSLTGVLPAEMEEEMYRMRSIRLAEHGFLPFEESLAVYSALAPDVLQVDEQAESAALFQKEVPFDSIPVSPLYYGRGYDLFATAVSGIADETFLNRIRFEFAGLCNQILSADGTVVDDVEDLIKTCRKASAHLNLALEEVCGTNIFRVEEILKRNPLFSVFRVGFGLVMELKWKTERWIKGSWFKSKGFDLDFWGHDWGETLAGLMEKRPRLYTGIEEDEEYRDFERLPELQECHRLINGLTALDKLFDQLTAHYLQENKIVPDLYPHATFHEFLFTLWARVLLKLKPSFSPLSAGQLKKAFSLLREGDKEPPYRMTGFDEKFINKFLEISSGFEPKIQEALKEILSLIWKEFSEEYAWVPASELDRRFLKFLQVRALK